MASNSLPNPNCCFDKGFYWDDLLLYAPHQHWNDAPPPAFWNGPVVKAAPSFGNVVDSLGR